MDKIFIKELTVETIVGVLPEERIKKQMVVLTITLFTDIKAGSKTDNINQAVNYLSISEFVRDMLESSRFYLIETLANEVVREIMLRFPSVGKVNIAVEKPQAISFTKSVGVEITRYKSDFELADVFVVLGSNTNKLENINTALALFKKETKILGQSSLYETQTISKKGAMHTDTYYNMALHIQTPLSIEAFKNEVCAIIEQQCGRKRNSEGTEPKTMDCDIVLFNREVREKPYQVPCPSILKNAYVTIPLAEVAPDYIHPVAEKTLSEISQGLDYRNTVKKISMQISNEPEFTILK